MIDNAVRNRIVKLSDEKLFEILNVENMEYTDETLKIVQEELIARGYTEVCADKEKESLKFRDLLLQVRFDDVQRILRKEFLMDKELGEKYRDIFNQLLSITPSEIDNINIFVDKHYDELTNTISEWNVNGYEVDSEEKFSVDLYYWTDWLAFNIKPENVRRVGKELFVACCLLKMTTHGFSTEEIESKFSEIITNSDEVGYDDYPAESSEDDTYDVHPWIRFWARTIDVILFSTLFVFMLAFSPRAMLEFVGRVENVVSIQLFFWVLVEAMLLSSWGTTPGKYLLGVTIRDSEGNKLSFLNALNRSASVWLWGFGCGIIYVEILSKYLSYKRLTDKGITRWDQNGKYKVSHGEVSILNIIIAVIILITVPILRDFGFL